MNLQSTPPSVSFPHTISVEELGAFDLQLPIVWIFHFNIFFSLLYSLQIGNWIHTWPDLCLIPSASEGISIPILSIQISLLKLKLSCIWLVGDLFKLASESSLHDSLVSSLLLGVSRFSRFILYVSGPRYGNSYFSKKPWTFF